MAGNPDDVKALVAEWIRSWREHAGLSIDEAVRASGVSQSTWSAVENMKASVPKRENLARMARAVGREPDELLEIAGWRRPHNAAGEPSQAQTDLRQLVLSKLDEIPTRSELMAELSGLARDVRDLGASVAALQVGAQPRGRQPSPATSTAR